MKIPKPFQRFRLGTAVLPLFVRLVFASRPSERRRRTAYADRPLGRGMTPCADEKDAVSSGGPCVSPYWSSSALATLLLPLLIFLAEVGVVTISTLRIIFVARGKKYLAPLLGTFEIVIWLYAVGQIMQNLSDVSCYLAF